MTTDPGDLVLDPTCGSGTTWLSSGVGDGSRLILSRSSGAGALALWALSLLPAGRFSRGQIKEGEVTHGAKFAPVQRNIRHGFVYERCRASLKSIANNAEIDVIWDQWEAKLEPLREVERCA
jgi:adenine-specific DNA-methyltransferase